MPLWVFFLLLGVCTAILILKVFIQKLQTRGAIPVAPNITMQDVWNSWMDHKHQIGEKEQRIVELVQTKFQPGDIDSIRNELLDLEKESINSKNPLLPLRKAIMKAVDEKYLCELLLNMDADDKKKLEDGIMPDFKLDELAFSYVTSNLKCGILRHYSFGKYGDGTKDDWFAFYCKAAESYAMNTVNLFKDAATVEGHSFHALLGKYYDPMMNQLREDLLKIPPKTEVPWSE